MLRGAGVATRAHHVDISGRTGDAAAIATLAEAGRTSAPRAPAIEETALRTSFPPLVSPAAGLVFAAALMVAVVLTLAAGVRSTDG